MSTVDEWARRQAEKLQEGGRPSPYDGFAAQLFASGANHLAALLLSDEAVSVMAESLFDKPHATGMETGRMRAALTAALTKITEDKE